MLYRRSNEHTEITPNYTQTYKINNAGRTHMTLEPGNEPGIPAQQFSVVTDRRRSSCHEEGEVLNTRPGQEYPQSNVCQDRCMWKAVSAYPDGKRAM